MSDDGNPVTPRRCILAGGAAIALAHVAGNRVDDDLVTTAVIGAAVVIVLAVVGLLALLVIRLRTGPRLTYRPDPAIYTRERACRADVVATYPARGPESNGAALSAVGAHDAARTPERPSQSLLAIGRGHDIDGQ